MADSAAMARSLWLQQALALDPGQPCPPLRGAARADVCIVGGGYTGLWTGLRIKQLEPACDVVVLEADICGGGASGRNGGFALSLWPKLESLAARCGEQEGLRLARDSQAAVDAIGAFCSQHGIDCHFRQAGWVWVATSPAQVGAWETSVSACERRGLDVFTRLSDEELRRHVTEPTHLAGVFEPRAATVQPALLARGLRRVALEQGVRIHEGSPMVELDRGRPPAVRTPEGAITAGHVVIATNAWAAGIRELRRAIAVISSDIVATEPVPATLERLRWTRGEAISDSRGMVHYYQATPEGRVIFGKGGGRLAFLGRVGTGFDYDSGRANHVARHLRVLFPSLAGSRITHAWAGQIDRTTNGLPFFGRLAGHPRISYGVGFSGNGVGPAYLGGRILASIALVHDDEWSRCGLVHEPWGRFPPEPVRYLGGSMVKRAVARCERFEDEGRTAGWAIPRLAAFAPAGFQKVAKR